MIVLAFLIDECICTHDVFLGSKWDMDDVLVHEAQANLQAIWIPELKTLFQVNCNNCNDVHGGPVIR